MVTWSQALSGSHDLVGHCRLCHPTLVSVHVTWQPAMRAQLHAQGCRWRCSHQDGCMRGKALPGQPGGSAIRSCGTVWPQSCPRLDRLSPSCPLPQTSALGMARLSFQRWEGAQAALHWDHTIQGPREGLLVNTKTYSRPGNHLLLTTEHIGRCVVGLSRLTMYCHCGILHKPGSGS